MKFKFLYSKGLRQLDCYSYKNLFCKIFNIYFYSFLYTDVIGSMIYNTKKMFKEVAGRRLQELEDNKWRLIKP